MFQKILLPLSSGWKAETAISLKMLVHEYILHAQYLRRPVIITAYSCDNLSPCGVLDFQK